MSTIGFMTCCIISHSASVQTFTFLSAIDHAMLMSVVSPPRQVRYLKIIEKSGYQALPWVRYITQNGGRLRVHRCLCRVPICAGIRQQLGNAVQCGGNQPRSNAVL